MQKNNNTFQYVRGLHPKRSMFDLSYEKKFTCDMGQLIPVIMDECVPGDVWKIANSTIIRFQPLVAPILHEINVYLHLFFVPNRILWEDWENFITGGVDGDDASVIPTWSPTNTAEGSLWDYCGLPTGIVPTGALPVDFPRRAYNLIYNEYYRDEWLQPEVLLSQETILNRDWEKDYFTSALLEQQRGVAPALPLYGEVPVHGIGMLDQTYPLPGVATYETGITAQQTYANAKVIDDSAAARNVYIEQDPNKIGWPNIRADLSAGVSVNISDLRLAVQTQKFLERNARGGARYTEFLQAHYGTSPRDERLQRPEYFGGCKNPVIISEVLQTSSTDGTSPQGNLAGHGISVGNAFCGKYRASEFGWIVGIMSIMPRSAYQNGVNRQFIKRTKYDYFLPEFVNLSEQAIENVEICAKNADATHNTTIFGYQGRYDELRIKNNMICGQMRTTFDYWHLGRQFDPATPPALNSSFVTCVPRKDIFAAPSEPGLIVSCGNIIHAYRPLPVVAEPGRMDHN